MSDALERALAGRLGEVFGTPVRVTPPVRLSAGASRETWSFDAGDRALILRRDPPERPDPETMAREAAVLTAAARGGVPVPRLVDHGDGSGGIGSAYLIMERLSGETIPRKLLREPRPGLAWELGGILARIHALPPDEVPGLPDADPLATLTEIYTGLAEPRPSVEIGLRWLAEHRPEPFGDGLVHGDFRNGNLMIGLDGVRGVLDWELMHRGDPLEDLGWLCTKAWRFGAAAPVGGFGTREELIEGYTAAGGAEPSPAALHWWEVYGTLRWLLICRLQAERHLSGAEPNVELAILGRRVCEQEHDLLLILGHAEPREAADVLAAPADVTAASPPHDRPGAAGLLDAIGAFLIEDVAAAGDQRLGYHARVAAAALRIARRELLLGEAHREAHRARLAALGCADDAALARAVRTGTLDDRYQEVTAAVRDTVVDKLLVAAPRHLPLPP